MSLSIIRCAKIIGTRTITNGNQRRMMTCWNGPSSITRRDPRWMVRKQLQKKQPPHLNPLPEGEEDENTSFERDNSNTRTGRTSADDNELAARRGIARSLDGAAASFYPRRFSDERRARGRDRAQAQAGLWLSPPQS